MTDLRSRILRLVSRPHLACLATVTADNRPWVRYVMVKGADDLSLRFASFANSRKVRQIRENPEVHLTCGVTDASAMTPYLQIQGRANFTQDAHERHAFWNDMLDNLFEGADDPLYGVVVVRPYRIEYCTPGGFEPEVWDASRETAPG